MRSFKLLAVLSVLFSFPALAQPTVQSVQAPIKEVTVYFNGAMLNHEISVNLKAGSNTIVANGISNAIDTKSIHAFANGTVKITAVVATKEFVTLKPKEVDAKIKNLEDSLQLLSNQFSLCTYTITDLEVEKRQLAENPMSNKSQSLSLIDMEKLLAFMATRRQQLNQSLVEQTNKKIGLETRMIAIRKELSERNVTVEKGLQQIQFLIDAPAATTAKINFSYLVSTAGWQPYYDMFVDDLNKPMKLKFKAKVFNNCGYDWTAIPLNLSTADPYESANQPVLEKWVLSSHFANYGKKSYQYNEAYNSPMSQTMDVKKQAKQQEVMSWNSTVKYDMISVPSLSLNFTVKDKYSIPTDAKPYDIEVAANEVNAFYEYFAVPKLDNDAFLIAGVSDWENLNLIDGQVNIFLHNEFAGQSTINAGQIEDTLMLSLGRDNKILTSLVKKNEYSTKAILGSTITENFVYEITVKNNNTTAARMEVQDQIPVSQQNDIIVELKNSTNAELDKDSGLLIWKLNLTAGETRKLTMEYSIKHPKSFKLNNTVNRKVIYCPKF